LQYGLRNKPKSIKKIIAKARIFFRWISSFLHLITFFETENVEKYLKKTLKTLKNVT